jgi:hypothetical protein
LSRQDKCEEAIFAASLCRVVDAYELVELNVQCLREGVVLRPSSGRPLSRGPGVLHETGFPQDLIVVRRAVAADVVLAREKIAVTPQILEEHAVRCDL